jgi:hypothetical protein
MLLQPAAGQHKSKRKKNKNKAYKIRKGLIDGTEKPTINDSSR